MICSYQKNTNALYQEQESFLEKGRFASQNQSQDISSSLKPIPTVAGRYEANETAAAFNSDAALSETKILQNL